MQNRVVISDVEAILPCANSVTDIFTYLIEERKMLSEKFNFIKNLNFYKRQYHVKTRIDKCAQLCIYTTEKLVKDTDKSKNNRLGLITVSEYGCANSKVDYLSQLKTLEIKQHASPKVFVQSISNIPNALATIECGITAFTNHYVGSSDAAIAAMWQAAKCIKDQMVQEMLVSSFDTITHEQMLSLSDEPDCQIKYCEAAASMKLISKKNVLQKNNYLKF